MKKTTLTILSIFLLKLSGCSQSDQNGTVLTFKNDEHAYQVIQSIADDFIQTVNKLYPKLEFNANVVVKPTQVFAYYDDRENAITLSWWGQLPQEGKNFFLSLTDSEPEVIEKEFGMLFNWIYVPHELTHALQLKTGRVSIPDFDFWQFEMEANEMAFAYYRSQGKYKELEDLYLYAKKLLSVLPDPVPDGKDKIEFFNENYPDGTKPFDPLMYGYFQMTQKVLIYENTDQPSFEEYLARFMAKVE